MELVVRNKMQNPILKFLDFVVEYSVIFSSIGCILGSIVVAVIVRVVYLHFSFKHIKVDVGSQNKSLDKLSEKVDKLHIKIDTSFQSITTRIDTLFSSQSVAKHNSPLTLTEQGLRIVDEIKANDIINEYKNQLDEVLKNKNYDLSNEYDIEKSCFEIVANSLIPILLLDSNKVLQFKTIAYREGLFYDGYLKTIFGILYRDKILKEQGFSVPIPNNKIE
jgi:hypothetical protein